jgi:tetratricopeptide (TPR) repeat protein
MKGSDNPAAFNAYLEGERLFSVTSEAQMAEARQRFEMAISLDPDFARAWGYLSYATVRSVLVGWLDRAELRHAEHCAKMAVHLGPDDYTNHWDLAFVYQNTERLDEAVEQYETARRLYDHYTDKLERKPGLLAEMAVAYVQAGEHKKAIELGEKAQLIPHWYRWNTGYAYYMAKDYDKAIQQFELMDFGKNRLANLYYVPEMELFIAAAYAMRAKGQKGKGAASDKRKTGEAMERFKRATKTRPFGKGRLTRSDVELRRCFKKKSDQAHWLEGLRQAGLWDKDNAEE